MKKILLITLFSLCFFISFSQGKISGTVLYYHNKYIGNKADVGSDIYILDSSIHSFFNGNFIDSFITAEKVYSLLLACKYQEIESANAYKGSMISKKKQNELRYKVPQELIDLSIKTNVADSNQFNLIDSIAAFQILLSTIRHDYNTKTDGVGNYSINVKKNGVYYVIIRSKNRYGVGKAFALSRAYVKKVVISDNNEVNVSTEFEL